MTWNRAILRAVLIGALVGALFVRLKLHALVGKVPFFTLDRALLGQRGLWMASVAGWIILAIYWEISAASAKAVRSEESAGSRGVQVFLTAAAQLMVLVPFRGLGRFLPVTPRIMIPGLALEAAGLFLALWARFHLGRNWSARVAVKVDHELIKSGPYRVLRHPIYTGLLAMYVGPAILTGEWLAVIGVGLAALAYWRKIRLEEETLGAAFGADYEAYRKTTWALVPGIF